MPFNIKPFEIDNMKELKTSTFNDIILSKYIQDDSLMIKLVDKDNDIHYYQCNAKFSHWYGELNLSLLPFSEPRDLGGFRIAVFCWKKKKRYNVYVVVE